MIIKALSAYCRIKEASAEIPRICLPNNTQTTVVVMEWTQVGLESVSRHLTLWRQYDNRFYLAQIEPTKQNAARLQAGPVKSQNKEC